MVSQLPVSTQTAIYEDSCGNIKTVSYDIYDELLTLDILDFEGADYVSQWVGSRSNSTMSDM